MPVTIHSPERTCLGCRQRDAKARLVRLASREGMVVLDGFPGARGRGGYLHPDRGCLDKFAASKVKEFRSLKSRIDRSERLRIVEAVKRRLDSEAALK